jgi:hypothetical protein
MKRAIVAAAVLAAVLLAAACAAGPNPLEKTEDAKGRRPGSSWGSGTG